MQAEHILSFFEIQLLLSFALVALFLVFLTIFILIWDEVKLKIENEDILLKKTRRKLCTLT